MNPIKRVLGHIYFFLGMLLFVVSMLLVFLPIWIISFFPDPQKTRLLFPIFNLWMGIFLPLVGCPVLIRGRKHFRKGQNYVVVCNHNSLVDIPVSSPFIPGPNKTLAKSEMARIPLFGMIYKTGSILVDRKSDKSRVESFSQMQQMLEYGLHLCLYPEGTRNKSGQPLQRFFDGAFITAIKAQKPIIPALIFHTKEILPGTPKFWAKPHKIRFHFLPEVSTEGLTLENVGELKDKIHRQMESYYLAHQS